MKTTIKITALQALVIEPADSGQGVKFSVVVAGKTLGSREATSDQCEVLADAVTRIIMAQSDKVSSCGC